jgi:hypothetical protein
MLAVATAATMVIMNFFIVSTPLKIRLMRMYP